MYNESDTNAASSVLMNIGVTENANSLSNFQPTILKGLGYTAIQAQIHTIPVYLVGAAFSVIFAYTSEWLQRRYYFYIMGFVTLAAGLAVEIAYPPNPKVRYMGMFFIACGCYLAMPISIIWVSMNCGSGNKRAVALAAIINFGTAGAFVSSNVFLFKETPRFKTGFSTGLGLACMGAVAATITWFGCKRENSKREQASAAMTTPCEKSVGELGDEHPDFRFAL
jgi:MFS family permease